VTPKAQPKVARTLAGFLDRLAFGSRASRSDPSRDVDRVLGHYGVDFQTDSTIQVAFSSTVIACGAAVSAWRFHDRN